MAIRLPGVRKGDMSNRAVKPEVIIFFTFLCIDLVKLQIVKPKMHLNNELYRLECYPFNFLQLVNNGLPQQPKA